MPNCSAGKSTAIQAHLAAEMAKAEAMEYERAAAALRDRIKALTAVQSVQAINPRGVPRLISSPCILRADRPAQVFSSAATKAGQTRFLPEAGTASNPPMR